MDAPTCRECDAPALRRAGRAATAAFAALLAGMPLATTAHAACPQELAVYSERTGSASIDFRPAPPTAAVHTAEFRVVFAQNGVVLDGIVMQTETVTRPYGLAMHDCPEGDVTGQELAACTVWQGILYAVGQDGTIGLLPAQGEAAAAQLLLPDFGPSVRHSKIFGEGGVSMIPWDAFSLSGCQE